MVDNASFELGLRETDDKHGGGAINRPPFISARTTATTITIVDDGGKAVSSEGSVVTPAPGSVYPAGEVHGGPCDRQQQRDAASGDNAAHNTPSGDCGVETKESGLGPATTTTTTAGAAVASQVDSGRASDTRLSRAHGGRANSTSDSRADSDRANSTSVPRADSGRANSTSVPRADSDRAKSTSVSRADSDRANSTSVPRADSDRANSTSVPRADSDRANSTSVPRADSDRANSTRVPRADSDRANSTRVPRADSDRANSTSVPRAVPLQAGAMAEKRSSLHSGLFPALLGFFCPEPDGDKKERQLWLVRGYQGFTLILTFLVYVSYHLSRKPLSVVKNSLHKNCSSLATNQSVHPPNDTTWCDWSPFDGSDYEHLFGWLDVGFLGTYAACMFLSGYVAERVNLRYFLTVGMLCAGGSVAMFGVGYFLNIHNFYYYLFMQIIAGGFQSTGWPAVVAAVGNWFGPGRRGAIMGLWNSHTSVGNILGALIPGVWADGSWGWSFVVPGIIIAGLGIVVFFFLVPYPSEVDIEVQNTRTIVIDVPAPDSNISTNSSQGEHSPLLSNDSEDHNAISLLKALRLPGVVEFSLCLFFAKLVSYTFLFWLPKYIGATSDFSAEKSADLSTLFDVGGVIGGFVAGAVTDLNRSPGINCVTLLLMGTPTLFVYQAYGGSSYTASIVLLLICGFFVNGPYALITTAVSADLGTQPALRGNKKALATVTSIIDGTGSIGAALGPLLTGWISPTGWSNVFYMLIAANVLAAFFLVRVVFKEVGAWCCGASHLEQQIISDLSASASAEVHVDPDNFASPKEKAKPNVQQYYDS